NSNWAHNPPRQTLRSGLASVGRTGSADGFLIRWLWRSAPAGEQGLFSYLPIFIS
ncbi:hypothetical protein GW17_00030226, partial [Ensete ventricosum]